MRVEQSQWTPTSGWCRNLGELPSDSQLLLVFGDRIFLKDPVFRKELRHYFPGAVLAGCSTAGEICGTVIRDGTVTVTAIEFDRARVSSACMSLDGAENSFRTGATLGGLLDPRGLIHVLVFSVGLNVNGSDLVRGLTCNLPQDVAITGGLAGDQDRFVETLVFGNEKTNSNLVQVVGIYGSSLKVGYGSLSGWTPFGPVRKITRSSRNILFDLDGGSALELYKTYLGEHAKALPGSALLIPLCVRLSDKDPWVVRTILSVDEKNSSLLFAGDMPQGGMARLMKASHKRLLNGAVGAAQMSSGGSAPDTQLALLISCVGRKMVLKQRTEEEIEEVRTVLGQKTLLTGFYSYGEISPTNISSRSELHNQTMTITTISETAEHDQAS